MFATTLAAVLLGSVSPGAAAVPTWKTDYATAREAAAAEQKPLAVFVGHGEAGYAKLVGGAVPADAGRLLAANFVCMYVDTDSAAGKELASKFGLVEGLVVSSKGGDVQALKHAGAVAPAALTGYLTKYADPAQVVTVTEKVNIAPAAPVIAPAAPVYTPVYRTVGGCPNGRCPNAR